MVSFVLQDGFARIYLDSNKLPCIGKTCILVFDPLTVTCSRNTTRLRMCAVFPALFAEPVEDGDAENEETAARKQCVVSLSPKTWKVTLFCWLVMIEYCNLISKCVPGCNVFLKSHQEFIKAYDITDTMIQPPNYTQAE